MQLQLIIAAVLATVVAAVSFGGAWQIQDWRYNAKEKERVESKLAEVRVSAARDLRWVDDVFTARDEAAKRAVNHRRDADASRAAADGLHTALDTTIREAESSQAACLERTIALSELFKERTDQYREVSEKADRHVNDIQTLIQGWPKQP